MVTPMKKEADRIPEGLYPMRAVTRFTGLSADVIRVWQRRYGAVEPDRTEGRARRFSADQIHRLLTLHELTRRGHSIGEIARLPDDRLRELLDRDSLLASPQASMPPAAGQTLESVIAEYLGAVGRFEMRRAQELLFRSGALLAPMTFVLNIAIPVLREVGDRWSRGELGIAQEHIVSGHMKALLSGLLRLAPPPLPGAPRLLAATPAGQQHEFGALMATYLAAMEGWEAIYAGPDLPLDALVAAADLARADLVLLSVLRVPSPGETRALERSLRSLARRVDTWVGLPADHPLRRRLGSLRTFDRLEDLLPALEERRSLPSGSGVPGPHPPA